MFVAEVSQDNVGAIGAVVAVVAIALLFWFARLRQLERERGLVTLFCHDLRQHTIGRLKKLFVRPPDSPRHLDRYDDTLAHTNRKVVRLRLVNTGSTEASAILIYAWDDELSEVDADSLDTRARTFLACAIYDAAQWMGKWCRCGPPNGELPSWFIGSYPAPFSLVNGSYSMAEKKCRYDIEPLVRITRADIDRFYPATLTLTSGFKDCFSEINV